MCWCGQTVGGAWERVQIFILAEGLKFALSGKGSSLVQHLLSILCALWPCPCSCPHGSEICDSRLSYLNNPGKEEGDSFANLEYYFSVSDAMKKHTFVAVHFRPVTRTYSSQQTSFQAALNSKPTMLSRTTTQPQSEVSCIILNTSSCMMNNTLP